MKRNYGLDILKILCVFLIVAHHYSVHGGFNEFEVYSFNLKDVYIQLLSMFGKISCSIFVLITGYYTVLQSSTRKIYKKMINIIIKLFIYSISIYIVLLLTGYADFSIKNLMIMGFPLFFGHWYIICYTVGILVAPLLNKILCRLSKSEFFSLISLLLLIWSIIPTFINFLWIFSTFDFFIIMYVIGAFIKLYFPFERAEKYRKKIFTIFFSSLLMLIISVLVIDMLALKLNSNFLINIATYFREYNSIISVILSISSFLFFGTLKLKNYHNLYSLSNNSLGIYIIHDCYLLNTIIWTKIYPNVRYFNNNIFLHSIIKITAVFILCAFIDNVYNLLVNNNVNRFIDKIFNYYDKHLNIKNKFANSISFHSEE